MIFRQRCHLYPWLGKSSLTSEPSSWHKKAQTLYNAMSTSLPFCIQQQKRVRLAGGFAAGQGLSENMQIPNPFDRIQPFKLVPRWLLRPSCAFAATDKHLEDLQC